MKLANAYYLLRVNLHCMLQDKLYHGTWWYHTNRNMYCHLLLFISSVLFMRLQKFCFHYRKICKTCKCGAADHDIKSDEDFTHQLILRDIQQLVTGPDGCGIVKDNIRKFRLASTGSKPEVFPKGNFLWVPSGVTKEVVGGFYLKLLNV